MSKENKVKIIYIVGLGHSGSTLLDRVISTSPQVFSVGELKFLKNFVEKYEPRNPEKKSFQDKTGKELKDSYFWNPIVKEAKEKNYNLYDRKDQLSFKDILKYTFFRYPIFQNQDKLFCWWPEQP